MLMSVILLVVLVIFNGFFAGSEIAFISVNENKLRLLEEKGDKKAHMILKLKEIPNRFLSTIQIGVSIASMLSGVFASEAFASLLTEWILGFMDLPMAAVKTFSMIIITLITSYFMLLFGELVPKRMAMANPQKFSYIAVYPLTILAKISTPLVKLLSASTNLVLKILGIDPNKSGEEITEEEIIMMVEEGKIDLIEKEMIKNIFDFDDTEVSEIMTHRTQIRAIDSRASLEEILDYIRQKGFTRFPVYEDNIDNIIGIIHAKELLTYLGQEDRGEFNISDYLIKPHFVLNSKASNELFRDLQEKKIHMAIVIDEYGGTSGLVTMEDLVEEVMGDILDEYDKDKEGPEFKKLKDGSYIAQGQISLRNLEELLEIEFPSDKYDSLSGFLIDSLGRIPSEKDLLMKKVKIDYSGYEFLVEAMDKNLISRVRIFRKNS